MKKTFITGLVILLPAALTLMIAIFLFDLFTEPFVNIVGLLVERIQERLHFTLPAGFTLFISRIFSLIFLCVFILLLGMVTRWLIVKNLLRAAHNILSRIPLIKSVYKTSRDIFSALFSADGKKAFKRPVMIPFPEKPNYCLGFLAGEVAEEIQEKAGAPLLSVFAPTAPHPISGFLFLVPEKDVCSVDMTNEDAVKFLVSCGMILPDSETPQKSPSDELF